MKEHFRARTCYSLPGQGLSILHLDLLNKMAFTRVHPNHSDLISSLKGYKRIETPPRLRMQGLESPLKKFEQLLKSMSDEFFETGQDTVELCRTDRVFDALEEVRGLKELHTSPF